MFLKVLKVSKILTILQLSKQLDSKSICGNRDPCIRQGVHIGPLPLLQGIKMSRCLLLALFPPSLSNNLNNLPPLLPLCAFGPFA
jgi:hypothetical protein